MAESAKEDVRTIDAGSYSVRIAPALRDRFAAEIVAVAPAHCFAVVTDVHVGPHYADALVASLAAHGRVSLHVIPAGETYKAGDMGARHR